LESISEPNNRSAARSRPDKVASQAVKLRNLVLTGQHDGAADKFKAAGTSKTFLPIHNQ